MRRVLLATALCSFGCSSETSEPGEKDPWAYGAELPRVEQDPGDPVVGRDTLLNGNYMSCGIPYKLWSDPTFGPTLQGGVVGGETEKLEGRTGKNAEQPYTVNVFTAADGAEVVNGNCLFCHAGRFDGKLVLGLGNSSRDFTGGLGGGPAGGVDPNLIDLLPIDAAEKEHMRKMLRLANIIGPETVMRTVGNNPAEALTAVLVIHHDQKTLAWSDQPLLPKVVKDETGAIMENPIFTSDPPPWWRAKKKNALFYNGMARGQHRGTMAMASSICVDSLAEAQRIDDLFRDIHAYVVSLKAPVYPRAIDAGLAEQGQRIFRSTCAGCHGKYDADPEADELDTYPNLLLPLDVIDTDPAVANAGVVHAPDLVPWYNGMFYGQVTPVVPDDPFPGYVAPPLDGVWATAPYLHNGSVPTVEVLLNSAARPKYWKRVDYDTTHFDEEALGWPYVEVAYDQASAPAAEKKYIYDTTQFSQSNSGHTFGDHLTDEERRAVIEYLKTL